jgi:hypothetical protein
LGSRVIVLFLLLVLCGCDPPPTAPKVTTQTKIDHSIHHTTTASNQRPRHELSASEKDKLFRNFERWLAAKKQANMKASPLVVVDQPPDMP